MARDPVIRPVLLAILTATSLIGAAYLGLLKPQPAQAQEARCSNTICYLSSACTFRQGYRCWFSDRRTCTTQQCPFLIYQ